MLCVCEGICEQIRNGRESHSSSCSPALRGSHSARGQSEGHQDCHRLSLPAPFARRTDVDHSRPEHFASVYVCPILSGARMRMRELSLRQDPDLRKELALLARGCDFVLPSRFKKRLRAFQQGQAGFCTALEVFQAVLNYSNSGCGFFEKGA